MNVGALATCVAGVHYFCIREFWSTFHSSPILYGHIDWSITVPLQMRSSILYILEFYRILSTAKADIGAGMMWRLSAGTIVMLASGYVGESDFIPVILDFICGICVWLYILHEVGVDFRRYSGFEKVAQIEDKVHPKLLDVLEKSCIAEAGSMIAFSETMNQEGKYAYQTMCIIVAVSWSVYPLGYFVWYLLYAVQGNVLNLIGNRAGFKVEVTVALCLAIWHAAKRACQQPGMKSSGDQLDVSGVPGQLAGA